MSMETRKRIVVEVETSLTDKQIEANGATIYLCEPEGECHQVLELVVEPRRDSRDTRGWQVDVEARLSEIERQLGLFKDGK